MITKIWLKGKTKGEDAIEYPDCWVHINPGSNHVIIETKMRIESIYLMSEVVRVEFRP